MLMMVGSSSVFGLDDHNHDHDHDIPIGGYMYHNHDHDMPISEVGNVAAYLSVMTCSEAASSGEVDGEVARQQMYKKTNVQKS
jgi:hypothetical protein